jgi:hypothetical protein
MLSPQVFGWIDGTSAQLREVLGELEGVSEETLARIDHLSRPTKDGPIPRDPKRVMLYDRLVLLALSEAVATLQSQKKQSKKTKSSEAAA